MHIDLIRDQSKVMPLVRNPTDLTTLRIWFCKYRTLRTVGSLRQLKTLVVAGFPDEDLEFLRDLHELHYLQIVHLPKITDLSPIASLQNLETLSLETLPSWDSGRKVTKVTSLSPLAQLASLRHLSLFGVVSNDRSLVDVERCKSLRSARFSQYPKAEIERFYTATKLSDAQSPAPVFDAALDSAPSPNLSP
jgi:hypothetical protein